MAEAVVSRPGSNEPPSHHGGLANLDEEHSYWIEEIEGALPADLEGTFFRNGPGRQRIGGEKYGHWFDGDGMVCAFTFRDGRAHFRNAYVRTPKYIDETRDQAIRYRGFGTAIPGGLLANVGRAPANPANTNTMYHAGRLFALNEGGHPWELDPTNLATLGECDFDGRLEKSEVFSAHGRIHPKTGEYVNFGGGIGGMSLKGPKPCLNVYRIAPSGELVKKGRVFIDHFPFCHDFVLTEHYAVFFVGSITFDGIVGVMLGTKCISDVVRYEPAIGMQVLVVDLETLELVKRVETGDGVIVHFGNAREDGDTIIIDGCYQNSFEANASLLDVFAPESRFNGGVFKRYVVDLKRGSLTEQVVTDTECEFPTFNNDLVGQRNRVTWTACSVDNGYNGFFNGFQRLTEDGDARIVTLPPGYYGSEPLFAPAKGATREDDGYLLEVVYDGFAHRSELQIYRADAVTDRVATLKLEHHLPHQFHGHFTREVVAKLPEV